MENDNAIFEMSNGELVTNSECVHVTQTELQVKLGLFKELLGQFKTKYKKYQDNTDENNENTETTGVHIKSNCITTTTGSKFNNSELQSGVQRKTVLFQDELLEKDSNNNNKTCANFDGDNEMLPVVSRIPRKIISHSTKKETHLDNNSNRSIPKRCIKNADSISGSSNVAGPSKRTNSIPCENQASKSFNANTNVNNKTTGSPRRRNVTGSNRFFGSPKHYSMSVNVSNNLPVSPRHSNTNVDASNHLTGSPKSYGININANNPLTGSPKTDGINVDACNRLSSSPKTSLAGSPRSYGINLNAGNKLAGSPKLNDINNDAVNPVTDSSRHYSTDVLISSHPNSSPKRYITNTDASNPSSGSPKHYGTNFNDSSQLTYFPHGFNTNHAVSNSLTLSPKHQGTRIQPFDHRRTQSDISQVFKSHGMLSFVFLINNNIGILGEI